MCPRGRARQLDRMHDRQQGLRLRGQVYRSWNTDNLDW